MNPLNLQSDERIRATILDTLHCGGRTHRWTSQPRMES